MIAFLKMLGWLFIGGSVLFVLLAILGACRMSYDIKHGLYDAREDEIKRGLK